MAGNNVSFLGTLKQAFSGLNPSTSTPKKVAPVIPTNSGLTTDSVVASPSIPSAPVTPMIHSQTPSLSTQQTPVTPTTPASNIRTTSSGITVNTSTGGVVNKPIPTQTNYDPNTQMRDPVTGQVFTKPTPPIQAQPIVQNQSPTPINATAPTVPTTTENPLSGPMFSSPEYESAVKSYEDNLKISPEEEAAQQGINNIESGLSIGKANIENQPIPLDFITGQAAATEKRALAAEQPLTQRLALLQAKRQASLEASKFKLDTEANRMSALREYNKPVSVAAGTSLVNPYSGKTVASGMSLSEKNSLDTFYNLAQSYPDAGIRWDDNLSAEQNLANAQKMASGSPSFQAKNTVYAINPLTGEPTIISKMGGGTNFGTSGGSSGGGTQGGGVSTNNLAPELKSALTNVSGVQFFDASKVTSAQLPYLQRAAQSMGIPLLTKEDANKVQESLQSFSSASALVDQIVNLTSSVLTAENNPGAQSIQAARLKAIELAPTISMDDNAKQFISARNSVLSLLTRAAGEKGVLTNQDIARVAEALPSYGDNAELAAKKAANFSSVLKSVLTGALSAYIGTPNGGSSSGTTGVTSSGLKYTVTP